jgi:hypothetical protein
MLNAKDIMYEANRTLCKELQLEVKKLQSENEKLRKECNILILNERIRILLKPYHKGD